MNLTQIISKLKDFIDGSLTNEEKLTEFNSLLTRITEVLVIDRPGSNDKLLSRVLSLDRRMDRWDQDKNTLKNLNEIVDEVSRKNTEVSLVLFLRALLPNNESKGPMNLLGSCI